MATQMELDNLTIFELMGILPSEVVWETGRSPYLVHDTLYSVQKSVLNAQDIFITYDNHYKYIPILDAWLRWLRTAISNLREDIFILEGGEY